MKLILASTSPRRRELLAELCADFTIVSSHVDEEEVVARAAPDHPEQIVTLLAEAKAREVARDITEPSLVVGADTIVWLDNQALNKPRDQADAVRMLLSLAGRTHRVYTGIAVVLVGDCVLRPATTAFKITEVEFHPMIEAEARAYVATGEPMDKAGAYGIQDSSIGSKFVKRIKGDYYNVVGLPLRLLRDMLSPLLPNLQPAPEQPQMDFPIDFHGA